MTKLKITPYSQRDSQWSNIYLGYNTAQPYTIGGYGCLITCLASYLKSGGHDDTPKTVNQILVDGGGYQAGTGNFIWSKCTLLGLNEVYSSPTYTGPATAQAFAKIKSFIEAGQPILCEVDFYPSTVNVDMHYVLLYAIDDNQIYAMDPWTGTFITLDVYGGWQRAIVQFRAYDLKVPMDNAIDPTALANAFVAVANKLGVAASPDVVLGECDKLIALEDISLQKDKKITTLTDQVNAIQLKAEGLEKDNTDLTQVNTDQAKKIGSNTLEITNLKNSIVDLQKKLADALKTTDSGWSLIFRGIGKLFGKG